MMNNEKNTWVVVADSAQCKIYEYNHHPEQVEFVKEIAHPESYLKDYELATDKQGHIMRGNYCNSDPKQVQIFNFSKEIAKLLDKDRKNKSFEHLILISSPHMHGLITKHLHKDVKKMIDLDIQKGLMHYTQLKLLHFLHKKTHLN